MDKFQDKVLEFWNWCIDHDAILLMILSFVVLSPIVFFYHIFKFIFN